MHTTPEIETYLAVQVKRIRGLWRICLCLPMAYLFVCAAVNYYYFIPRSQIGIYPLSQSTYELAFFSGLIVALGIEAAIFMLRRDTKAYLVARAHSPRELIESYRWRFFIMAALCDTVSFIGVILFLLNGTLKAVFIFGLLALICYAQIHPSTRLARAALEEITPPRQP